MNKRAIAASSVTWIGLGVNFLLTLFKLVAGVVGHSGAMTADALHSLSDCATDVVILISFRFSAKPADKGHKYGHGKYETLATVVVAAVLMIAGAGVLKEGTIKIWRSLQGESLEAPGIVAMIAAALSIIIKESLYRYTAAKGRQIRSRAVIANAWHHRSDALTSVGTLAGIGGAIFLGERWHVLDPLAAVVVSLFIFKIAATLLSESLRELVEESLSTEVEAEIMRIAASVPEVTHPHNLRTRRIGSDIAVDLHIRVPSAMRVDAAHAATKKIESEIRECFGESAFISIHIEPEHSPPV